VSEEKKQSNGHEGPFGKSRFASWFRKLDVSYSPTYIPSTPYNQPQVIHTDERRFKNCTCAVQQREFEESVVEGTYAEEEIKCKAHGRVQLRIDKRREFRGEIYDAFGRKPF